MRWAWYTHTRARAHSQSHTVTHTPAHMLRSSQNSAAAYAVRSTLSDAELAQARTAFFETDRDGSGAIDRSELARMLKSLGQTPTKRMIEEIFIALKYNFLIAIEKI